jgi:hypothetical protein
MTTIAERVAAGAAFLDEHDPGWWEEDVERAISLDWLDLGDDETCVLGQRCPLEVLHAYALEKWGSDDADDDERYVAYAHELSGLNGNDLNNWATEFGFALADTFDRPGWNILTTEWAHLIEARRAEVSHA